MGTFAETSSSIFVYCLPTKENKLPFSVSVFRKQMEICHLLFLFAASKTDVAVFRLFRSPFVEFRKHGD
jgi:hypothetical protein